MGLHFVIWSATLDQVDVTDNFDRTTLAVKENGAEASVAIYNVELDDPTNALDIGAARFAFFYDDRDETDGVLGGGITAPRDYQALDGVSAQGRRITLQVADINSVLSVGLFTADASRPSETDLDRIAWLAGITPYVYGDPYTILSLADPMTLDAADYTNQTPLQVLQDCMAQTGKNGYVTQTDPAFGAIVWSPWDDARTAGIPTTIMFSNYPSDIDGVTGFALSDDTRLTRDPSTVVDGVVVVYNDGADTGVYWTDITRYRFPFARKAVLTLPKVTSAGAAEEAALRHLDEHGEEDVSLTTTVYMPAEKFNILRPGMACRVRATHLPGFREPRWARVTSRTVRWWSDEEYRVDYELRAIQRGGEGYLRSGTEDTGASAYLSLMSPPATIIRWRCVVRVPYEGTGGTTANLMIASLEDGFGPGDVVAAIFPSTDTIALYTPGGDLLTSAVKSGIDWSEGVHVEVAASATEVNAMMWAVGEEEPVSPDVTYTGLDFGREGILFSLTAPGARVIDVRISALQLWADGEPVGPAHYGESDQWLDDFDRRLIGEWGTSWNGESWGNAATGDLDVQVGVTKRRS